MELVTLVHHTNQIIVSSDMAVIGVFLVLVSKIASEVMENGDWKMFEQNNFNKLLLMLL